MLIPDMNLMDTQLSEYRTKQHMKFILSQINRSNEKMLNDDTSINAESKTQVNNTDISLEENNVSYVVQNRCNEDEVINYNQLNSIYKRSVNTNEIWKNGTTLIIGDSMLYGIDEKRLKNTKVRIFPGASIEDLFFNISPLLRKKPNNIICHIGTNNTINENSNEIMEKLMKLKEYIKSKLPNCNLIFSSFIDRYDNAKAQLTVNMVNKKLIHLESKMIDNKIIMREHLGKKGLHMTPCGTGKLVFNYLKALKKL